MQTYSQTFTGAQTWQLNIQGRYFALIDCATVNVRLYRGGKLLDTGDIRSIGAGLEIGPLPEVFDRVEVDALAADTITIGIGNGQARYNARFSQPVRASTVTQSNVTVTNGAGGSTILAANAQRKWLAIQNNDMTGNLYVTFDGSAPTTASGIKIAAGGFYEPPVAVPTTAIKAIGDIASNANVVVVQGA